MGGGDEGLSKKRRKGSNYTRRQRRLGDFALVADENGLTRARHGVEHLKFRIQNFKNKNKNKRATRVNT